MKYIITESQYSVIKESKLSLYIKRRLKDDSISERIIMFLSGRFHNLNECNSVKELISLASVWIADDILDSLIIPETWEDYWDMHEVMKQMINNTITKNYKELFQKKCEEISLKRKN
jgi:hypothetical protein